MCVQRSFFSIFTACYILLQIQHEITAEIIHTVLQYLALNQRHLRDHNIISGNTNYVNIDLQCRVVLDCVIFLIKKEQGQKCLSFFCPWEPVFQLPPNYSVGGGDFFLLLLFFRISSWWKNDKVSEAQPRLHKLLNCGIRGI